jgi:Uncharacterized protein conserved in bacteria (DUF2066)
MGQRVGRDGREDTGVKKRAERNGVIGRGLSVPIVMLAALLAGAMPAVASDAVYTIGNYPVDARANDAVAAKTAAIANGQKAALRSLLKRLVPVTAYPRLRKLQLTKMDAYLSGISVRSERNSTTEYIANLDFAFRPDAVRALLDRENLPYVDAQAPAITIVPIWLAETQPIPGVPADAWRNAWANVDVAHALTPAKLETMKPGVHADTVAALAKGDTTLLRTFAGEYGGEERLVAAILMPLPKERKLQVTLAGRDTVGSLAWIKTYKFDAEDPGYAIELAAVVSLGVLEGRWKASGAHVQGPTRIPGTDQIAGAPTAAAASNEDGLRLSVEFASMGEWSDISKRLGQVPGVENIDVIGLSGRSARITLRYPDGVQRLADVAPQHGLSMRQNAGGWVLSGGR